MNLYYRLVRSRKTKSVSERRDLTIAQSAHLFRRELTYLPVGQTKVRKFNDTVLCRHSFFLSRKKVSILPLFFNSNVQKVFNWKIYFFKILVLKYY